MEMFCPKIELINYFDELINRVDIEFEECLEKYSDNQLKELKRCFQVKNGEFDEWPESTKVVDYLNQVRMRTIEELRKEQNEALEYYKLNSLVFQNQLKDETKIEELKSQLFGEKFYFQVLYKPLHHESWIFNLFTICVDFYMSPNDIDLLE